MDQNRPAARKRLLRPVLALTFGVLALLGAVFFQPWDLAPAYAWFAAIPAVIVLAQLVDRLLCGPTPAADAATLTAPRRPWYRIQFGLRTLLLITTVTAFFLGMSRYRDDLGEEEMGPHGYAYGFPFHCLKLETDESGTSRDVDIPWLIADIAAGAALIAWIELEIAYLGRRRKHHAQQLAGAPPPHDETPSGGEARGKMLD